MATNKQKAELEQIYKAFSKEQDVNLRSSILIRAVSLLDPICASLQRLHKADPSKGYLPADAVKNWTIAGKCRARALSTTFPEEKETSLRMAIKYIEKVIAKLDPPKIDKYIDIFEGKVKATTNNPANPVANAGQKAPKTPKAAGNQPSGISVPPLGADGLPSWKAGTSIRLCCDVLVKGSHITLDAAILEIQGKFTSSNPVGRLKMVANILCRLGILEKAKINGMIGYKKVVK